VQVAERSIRTGGADSDAKTSRFATAVPVGINPGRVLAPALLRARCGGNGFAWNAGALSGRGASTRYPSGADADSEARGKTCSPGDSAAQTYCCETLSVNSGACRCRGYPGGAGRASGSKLARKR
jgi:hypothetical protein